MPVGGFHGAATPALRITASVASNTQARAFLRRHLGFSPVTGHCS
jgi:hypothetical protein